MQRFIVTCVVSGLIAGLLWGGFHNLFTVPVIERAITLEEERSAGGPPPTPEELAAETPVSLGVQRIGMAVGTTIIGAVFGLVFAGGYILLRRAAPGWHPLALAFVTGALGFWAISLFPFIKFPLVPPGVGEQDTLLLRQLFQTLFFVLSAAGAVGLLIGIRAIRQGNSADAQPQSRMKLYASAFLAYVVFAIVIFLAIPGNPDPIPVPIDLLELFRTLTIIGHFIVWVLLASGVALAIYWRGRAEPVSGGGQLSAVGNRDSRS